MELDKLGNQLFYEFLKQMSKQTKTGRKNCLVKLRKKIVKSARSKLSRKC